MSDCISYKLGIQRFGLKNHGLLSFADTRGTDNRGLTVVEILIMVKPHYLLMIL